MRDEYVQTVNKYLPFDQLLNSGMSPAQIKGLIIATLRPYVHDKDLLQHYAIDVFSNEAMSVGILTTQQDWKDMLDLVFFIRETAFSRDKVNACAVFCACEDPIREAQRKYSLAITFERQKDDFELDEFAHEIFNNIGSITESTIQPFLKELCCLAEIAYTGTTDLTKVSRMDFGKVVETLERLLPDPNLVSPKPWSLRLNQWRNIAQHHSYKILNNEVIASYGKSNPPKRLIITRDELFRAAKELIRRLGILKSSRELTMFNHAADLRNQLPKLNEDVHTAVTELGAAFNTQGFQIKSFKVSEKQVSAEIIDVAPCVGPERHIHCSQFILPLAFRFPKRKVNIHFLSNDLAEQWFFSASAEDLGQIVEADNPIIQLAGIIKIKKLNERED